MTRSNEVRPCADAGCAVASTASLPPRPRPRRRVRRSLAAVCAAALLWGLGTWAITASAPPPGAVGLAGPERLAVAPRWLADDTWIDADGERRLRQSIFDALFERIARAQRLVYLDVFLFNGWQGPVAERHRALADELADRLIEAARRPDGPVVVLVTDPINTVYGGVAPERLARLERAGVTLVLTDLVRLQDSNPAWSSVWRWLIRPFGNRAGARTLPNPFGAGRVSLRSWLALLNFKANHRKLAVFDGGTDGAGAPVWRALLTSANPHDGSSAHRNVALEVGGAVVGDVLSAERALLELLGASEALARLDGVDGLPGSGPAANPAPVGRTETPEVGAQGGPTVRLVNESSIRDSLLAAIDAAGDGDAIDLEMFYLAERRLVGALGAAARRGVRVRVLLDVNRDAFGRAKNGVPNRPVAAELTRAGVRVRWCATQGEQCHAKWVHVRRGDVHAVWVGSGNLTRRNLADLNLESDLLYRAGTGDATVAAMLQRFARLWDNEPGRTYSTAYATHANGSRLLAWQYRFMEATGLGTF